jgi:hypothetical protein
MPIGPVNASASMLREYFTGKSVFYGAPQGNKLEPSDCASILEELESWTEILKAEPEVIHRLAVFAEASEDDAGLADDASLAEPSP